MKRIITIMTLAIAVVFASSCTKSDDYKPVYLSFVTAEMSVGTPGGYTFSTDSNTKLILSEAPSVSLKFTEGQRVLIYFNIIEDNQKSCKIKLIGFDNDIAIGRTDYVSTPAEAEEYGTAATSFQVSPNEPNATNKYINLYLGFVGEKTGSHVFSLIHIESEFKPEDKSLNLKLMHQDGGDKGEKEFWGWVSFPVHEIERFILGNETYKISVKTRLNGVQEFKLAIPKNTGNGIVAE